MPGTLTSFSLRHISAEDICGFQDIFCGVFHLYVHIFPITVHSYSQRRGKAHDLVWAVACGIGHVNTGPANRFLEKRITSRWPMNFMQPYLANFTRTFMPAPLLSLPVPAAVFLLQFRRCPDAARHILSACALNRLQFPLSHFFPSKQMPPLKGKHRSPGTAAYSWGLQFPPGHGAILFRNSLWKHRSQENPREYFYPGSFPLWYRN